MAVTRKTSAAVKPLDTKAVKPSAAPAAVAAPAKVETAPKKEAAPKKETVKEAAKTAAKKETPKKETVKKTAKVFVEYGKKQISMDEIVKKAEAAYVAAGHTASEIKTLEVYVKPEENVAYYVVNGEGSDDRKVEL